MRALVLIFLGAGLGGVLRHFANIWCQRWLGAQLPWGVFVVNVSGSLAMGLAAGYFAFKAGTGWSQSMRLFVTTGVLGGYTTFSAFSLDAVTLIERGDPLWAGLYVGGSVGLSISALFLGLFIVRTLT